MILSDGLDGMQLEVNLLAGAASSPNCFEMSACRGEEGRGVPTDENLA